MMFIQPVAADHAGTPQTAQVATLNAQARAHGRVRFTFGQLAQIDSTTNGGGTGFNNPGAGTLPSPVTAPVTPAPTNDNTPSSGVLPGTGSGMGQDTSLGKSTSPTNPASPLPPIDTTPVGTGASGTGAGEGQPAAPSGSAPNPATTPGIDTSGMGTGSPSGDLNTNGGLPGASGAPVGDNPVGTTPAAPEPSSNPVPNPGGESH
jgi:hypothetical protein